MDREWQEFAGVIGIFALLITIVVVTVTQVAAVKREKVRRVRDDEYRKFAEECVTSLRNMERQLTELSGHLTEMRTRIASVEKILQQVE